MLVDSLLIPDTSVSLIANQDATTEHDVFDTGAAGQLANMEIVIVITTAVVGAGASVQFKIEHDTAVGMATNNVVLIESAAIPVATLVAGYEVLRTRMPANHFRYIRLQNTVTGAATTAGAAEMFFVRDRQTYE